SLLRRLAQFGHRSMDNAAPVDPVLLGASLCPGWEVEHAKARILAPSGQHHELTGGCHALAHGFDFALVLGTEWIISFDLGDVRHAPLLRRDAVFAPASAHVDRSTPRATGFSLPPREPLRCGQPLVTSSECRAAVLAAVPAMQASILR